MNIDTLTKKEYDIMTIFWNETESLSLHNLVEKYPALNKNTTQALLKKLLKMNYIQVAEIGYSNTVLTRKYVAKLTQYEYFNRNLSKDTAYQIALEFIKNADEDQKAALKEALNLQ